jgi:hypothetical protein
MNNVTIFSNIPHKYYENNLILLYYSRKYGSNKYHHKVMDTRKKMI